MAKINVEFDTKDKILNVKLDGTTIENVSSVDFFQSFENDDFHGSITTIEKVDEDDLVKVIRVSADDGLSEVVESSNLPKILANKLFPTKVV